MTKIKQKQKKGAAEGNAAQQKRLKKEEQMQQKKQLQAKRQRYYGVAIVVILLALVISFASGPLYGQPLYHWLQIACYGFMAVCGFVTMLASRYEETDKKRLRMQSIGMIFMAIALGMVLLQLGKLFM